MSRAPSNRAAIVQLFRNAIKKRQASAPRLVNSNRSLDSDPLKGDSRCCVGIARRGRVGVTQKGYMGNHAGRFLYTEMMLRYTCSGRSPVGDRLCHC